MKTRYCDQCEHASYSWQDPELICAKGHKPRFYQPKRVYDYDWGWKRKCEDFKQDEALQAIEAS